MAIPHAVPGQPIDLRPLAHRLRDTRTVALFKTEEIEVMRLVLPAGKSVPPHKVAGEITVQCLEGQIEFTSEGGTTVLPTGHLLYLSGSELHSLVALEDASVLVTIVLRK